MTSVNQVPQEAAQKADIVFSVKSPLSASYLVMVSPGALADESPSLDPMQSFSQEVVDAGRILYLHSCPEAWSDAFSLVVASAWALPSRTYRRARGAAHCHPHRECKTSVSPRVAATPWSLHCSASPGPTSPFSRALACRFWSHPGMGPCRRKMGLMPRPSAPSAGERTYDPRFPPVEAEALKVSLLLHPKAGHLGPDCQPWACPLVEEQLICYVHEGSETLTDSFVLMANVSEMDRQSHPVAFTVTILPVNGQPANLTTNAGLQEPSDGALPPTLWPLLPRLGLRAP
ncbi:hypothetical protein H8958_006621 [Nasalis larvatus]